MCRRATFFAVFFFVAIIAGFFAIPSELFAADSWSDTTFLYRKKITFNNASSSEDLSNFPVAVILNSSNIDYSKTQNSGQDIRFTDSDGTTALSYEIEKWDESATSTVWVKVPTVTGTSSVDYVYMYYGSSTATSTASSSAVWESSFAGVWHFSESPSATAPQAQDSTSNNRDGTSFGSMRLSDRTNAPHLGSAWTFDGSNDTMQVTSTSALNPYPMTLTLWTKIGTSSDAHIVNKYISSSGNGFIIGYTSATGTLYAYYYGSGGSINAAAGLAGGPVSTSTWVHLTLLVNSSGASLYYNGSLLSSKAWSGTPSPPTTSENLKITCYTNFGNTNCASGSQFFKGIADEFRVASTSRSASWIFADYLTGSNQFNSFSSEEGVPTIQFSYATSSGGESATPATLVLQLSATSSQNISVQYVVQASSTATGSGRDYSLSNGTSTIAAGNSTTSISITISDDAVVEPSETIVVRIATSTNAVLGSAVEHVFTLTDNDSNSDAWWNSGWFARKKINLSNGSSTEHLQDFPVLVSLYSATIDYSKTQNSGQDIRFTDSDGTTALSYEIEKWDESATSTVWVKVPQIDLGTTTDHMWMYYNNTGAGSESSSSAVWDSGFRGVWHFSESPSATAPQARDSTVYGNHLTSNGSMTSSDLVQGRSDGSWDFDGSNDIASSSYSTSLDVTSTLTISAWIKPSLVDQYRVIMGKDNGSIRNYLLQLNNASKLRFYNGASHDDSTALTADQWKHVAVTVGTSLVSFYCDGVLSSTSTQGASFATNTHALTIGGVYPDAQNDNWWSGIIDEPRLSIFNRSASWLLAEYKNGALLFNSFGTEQVLALPTSSFSNATSSGSESTATATIELFITATSSNSVMLTLATSGTASYGTDYTMSTTTAVISAGNTTTSISLTILNDALDELDETVILTITTSTNSTIGSTSTLTYTITDDDATPTISFSLATSSVSESTTTSTIIIALSASSSFITTVQYSVQASSTATGSGTDYTLTNGTSTIQAGNTTTSIQVSIINDSDVEASEILVLRLSNPASSTLGSVTDHVLTITDNDSYPEVYFVSSTHAGAESSNATILVQLSATSSVTSTLTFSTSGTATYALDYSLSTTTVTISPGFSTTSFTLTVVNDALDELDETVILTITTSTNSTLGSTSTLTYTIQDNDAPPTIQFQATSSSGSEASSPVSLVIELSASSSFITTVQYSVQASSTATGSGTDYTLTNGTSTIQAGNTTTSISLSITDDALYELNEIVVIQLASPASSTLGTNTQFIYTITENDSAPTISFSLATSSVAESTATATIIIALSASSSFVTTVQYSVQASSTATGSGTDYTLSNGTSMISAGNTTTSISISIVDDSDVEASEIVVLRLATPASSTLGAITDHTLTITDNDTVLDSTAPSISGVSASAQSSAVTITWTTDEAASSQVTYGTDQNSLNTQTSESDTSTRVTSHSVSLSSLQVCRTYYFKVSGSDSSSNISTSTTSSFTTSGCSSGGGGGSAPSSVQGGLRSTNPTYTPPSTQIQTPPVTQAPVISTPTPTPIVSSFNRSLTLGDIGEDVKTLQRFLNQNGFTVADSGPGSPGQETTKFGALTKLALIKFQDAYKDQILTPSGLQKGTGYFGKSTIAFLEDFKPETKITPKTPEKLITPAPVLVEKTETPVPTKSEEPAKFFHRGLALGDTGEDVKLLQQILAKNENIYPEGVVSGYFGGKTLEAVKRFQLLNRIAGPDDIAFGFVGPKTRTLLNVLAQE